MDKQLKDRLKKEFGLTDEQIVDIENLGVNTEADMGWIREADLDRIRIPVVIARKIVAAFAPKAEPAAAQTPVPSTIIVKTGRPDAMALRELLQAIADGERSVDFVNELRRRVSGKAVFVRKAGMETLDVDETMALIDHAGDDQPPDFWGDLPCETLDEILDKRKMANPITGAALGKGDAWLGVVEDRRVLAAYARLASLLTGKEDEYSLIGELRSETLIGRWPRIKAAFDRAEKSHDRLVDQARSAMFYNKGSRPGIGQVPFRSAVLLRSDAGQQGGVNISGSVQVSGSVVGRDLKNG